MAKEEEYSLLKISNILNIPESTLRGWKKQFEQFLPTIKKHNKVIYNELSLEIFKKIALLKEEGLFVNDILDRLTEEAETVHNYSNTADEQVNTIIPEVMPEPESEEAKNNNLSIETLGRMLQAILETQKQIATTQTYIVSTLNNLESKNAQFEQLNDTIKEMQKNQSLMMEQSEKNISLLNEQVKGLREDVEKRDQEIIAMIREKQSKQQKRSFFQRLFSREG